jgi:predicted Zn-dependent protease
MAKAPKFPPVIHVTQEGDGDDTYLSVAARGLDALDEDGTEVAVYQLVEVGHVRVAKSFQSKQRAKSR